jgi:serine phosphatase RsbU (regulator of sigma subunit)
MFKLPDERGGLRTAYHGKDCNIHQMAYRPKILVQQQNVTKREYKSLSDSLMCKWPCGMPPIFITAPSEECDVALIFANGEEEILELLPRLLELHAKHVSMLICCDDFEQYGDLITDLDVTTIAYDATPSVIAGVLYGLLQRNEEVSQLRGQVGFVRTLHSTLQKDFDFLQSELEIAATVQREFMSTEVQSVHGVSFTSLWRPASVVSGDMYDITQIDDDHVAFFIADAIGHGISAAMLAMMLTRTISAHRFDSANGNLTEPEQMLRHLNEALLQRSGEHARFATAAYGILNCKTNALTYAGAGHPPALLSRYGGDPIVLESDGPLLGVFDGSTFPQRSLQLTDGDTLLLYSDGFEQVLGNELCSDGDLPTYLKSMHEFCVASGSDVITNIDSYLNNSFANSADDDLTMICLRATPTPHSLGLAA